MLFIFVCGFFLFCNFIVLANSSKRHLVDYLVFIYVKSLSLLITTIISSFFICINIMVYRSGLSGNSYLVLSNMLAVGLYLLIHKGLLNKPLLIEVNSFYI